MWNRLPRLLRHSLLQAICYHLTLTRLCNAPYSAITCAPRRAEHTVLGFPALTSETCDNVFNTQDTGTYDSALITSQYQNRYSHYR